MFAWLFSSFVIYALQMIVTVYGLFYFSHDHWYVVYGATMMFFFMAALCLLKAAVALNRIRYAEPPPRFTRFSFYGKPIIQEEGRSNSAVNAIVYLAGLASNKTAIDPILDELRSITSQLASGTEARQLTQTEQDRLAKVYLQIEDYLVAQEKIGNFSRSELRERAMQKFQNPAEAIFLGAA